MSNLIKLPEKPVREWLVLEKALRPYLLRYSADSDLTDYVCAAMRPVFLKHAAIESTFVPGASMTPEEAGNALNDWMHALVGGVMLEVAVREVELYKLRGCGSSV